MATLPCSAAVRVVFTLARTTAEDCAALLGCLERLRPRFPQGKGQVERSIGYLELVAAAAAPADLADLQAQADQWTVAVAGGRVVRRLGARVADALAVERASLRRLPSVA